MAFAPLLLSLGAAVLSSDEKKTQADIERGQAEVAAKEEALGVSQREADRKDRLATSIASQNSMAGASGIAAFEGSPLTIINDSIERENVATGRDKFQGDIRALGIRSIANVRRRAARTGANIGLLQAGASAARVGV